MKKTKCDGIEANGWTLFNLFWTCKRTHWQWNRCIWMLYMGNYEANERTNVDVAGSTFITEFVEMKNIIWFAYDQTTPNMFFTVRTIYTLLVDGAFSSRALQRLQTFAFRRNVKINNHWRYMFSFNFASIVPNVSATFSVRLFVGKLWDCSRSLCAHVRQCHYDILTFTYSSQIVR